MFDAFLYKVHPAQNLIFWTSNYNTKQEAQRPSRSPENYSPLIDMSEILVFAFYALILSKTLIQDSSDKYTTRFYHTEFANINT